MELAAFACYRKARYRPTPWSGCSGTLSRGSFPGPGQSSFYSNTIHLRTGHDGADEDSPAHGCLVHELLLSAEPGPPDGQHPGLHGDPDGSGLQLHMPFTGTVSTHVPGGAAEINLRSRYPWEATTELEVAACSSEQPWVISLRIPDGSSEKGTRGGGERRSRRGVVGRTLCERGQAVAGRRPASSVKGHPVRVVKPHWRVDAVRDCVAVQRGPLVYCLEAEDLGEGVVLEDVFLG